MTAEMFDLNTQKRLPEGFRRLPHNIEAEVTILGSIMADNSAYEVVHEFLKPEHFYSPVHGRIYQAIAQLIESGRTANRVTLAAAFHEDPELKPLDGAQYLTNLVSIAETVPTAKQYALQVLDLAAKRALIGIGQELINVGFEPTTGMEWPDLAARARKQIDQLEAQASTSVGWLRIGQVLESLARKIEAPSRHTSTGLHSLDDNLCGGFLPGGVYGIEAPPKFLKTGMLATIARHLMHQNVKFLYVMADRTVEEAISRIAAADLKINSSKFSKGNDAHTAAAVRGLDYHDCAMLAQEPSLKFGRLKALFGHAVQLGARGFILDYWQRVDAVEGPKDSKPAALGRVADWLKGFCIEHDVWTLVASQQNRDGETLWSGELERACVWLGKIKRVEYKRSWGVEECAYMDVPLRTMGKAGSIGSEDTPAWKLTEAGPLLVAWMP